MATTFEPYTGDNSDTTFAFNHPSYQESDIKVTVDGAPYTNTGVTGGSPGATTFTIPSYTTSSAGNIVFNTAPGSGAVIRIFRDTNVDVAKATFQAGSSVKAADLNNTVTQLLYAAQEEQNQLEQTADIQDSAITSAKIADGTIVNADINASADISVSKLDHGTARQVLQTNSSGNGVEFTSSVDLPGTFQVRGNAFLDATTNVSGDLTVFNSGTQKFKVTKNDGNTDIEGTLDVAGTTTLAGNLDVAGTTGIAAADVTSGVTKVLVETGNDSQIKHGDGASIRAFINVEDGATADQTASDIKTLLASDNLTDAHLAENSVGTSEIKDDAVGPDQLANTAVTPTSYGSSTSIPTITVDAQGRITAASGNTVSFDVVADTSPSLGGDLDVEDKKIKTTTTNGAINIEPNGTGFVSVRGTGTATGTISFGTEDNNKGIKIKAPTAANLPSSYELTLPVNDGDNGQFLKTDGLGVLSWDTISGGGGGGGTAAPNNIVTLSESVDGNRTDFSMSVTPASAQNLIVSVNGVVQKPNAGTTIAGSAEGYCVDGATLKFATAPANGSSIFIIEHAATTASDRIVEGNSNVDIFDDNATSRAVVNLDGAEKFRINEGGQIGLAGANYGTDGQVLTSQGPSAAAQWESLPSTDLVTDTSPQLGGDLDVQSNKITTSTTNANVKIEPNGTGVVEVRGAGGNDGTLQLNCSAQSHGVKITSPPHSAGASYTLNLPDSLAIQTPVGGVRALGLVSVPGNTSTGTGELGFGTVDSVQISSISTASAFPIVFTNGTNTVASSSTAGSITITPNASINLADNVKGVFGTNSDLQIYHDSADSYIANSQGDLYIQTTGSGDDIFISAVDDVQINVAGQTGLKVVGSGETLLYYNGASKLETYADGVSISSKILVGTGTNGQDSADELTVANTGDCGITIRSGSSNTGNLFFSDTTSGTAEYAGYVQYAHGNNHLYFGSNSTLGMTLDSSQRVGIGTANPSSWNADADKLVIYEAGQNTGMTISSNGNHNCNIFFADSDTDGAPEYAGYVQYSHASDELRLGASATDKLKITNSNVTVVNADLVMSNGNGISFAATPNGSGSSSIAEKLSDYEEGTWTPVLQATTTNPSGGSLTTLRAEYVRIGSMVHLMGYIGWDANYSGAAGNATIGGLPFVGNTNEYGSGAIGFYYVAAGVITSGQNGGHAPSVYVDNNKVYFYSLRSDGGAGSGTGFDSDDWYNGTVGHVQFTVHYRIP